MNAKSLCWALVSATAVVTASGLFIPELGLAVASTALGGSALAASFLVRRSAARYSEVAKRMKEVRV